MPNSRTLDFLARLLEGTRQGTVPWNAETDQSFTLNTEGTLLRIYPEDADRRHPFVFEVVDVDGNVVETLTSAVGRSYAPWELELGELWELARRRALGVDDILGSVADTLHLPPPPTDDIPF